MARRLLRLPMILGFLIFFLIQAVIIIHYAQQMEDRDEVRKYYATLTSDQLLSQEKVSRTVMAYRNKIKLLNEMEIIYNVERYGATDIDPETPTFVVQVHDRLSYLKILVESLKSVDGINETLLIFSHDHYSDEMNMLVRDITFARVLQIYYPYSTQLYPKGYPGPDPTGVELPKGYGRTAQLAQIKLHWVWKLTHLFRDAKILANHTGPKIFLEEDHFVLPDALHTLTKILDVKKSKCPNCLPVLGGYPKEKLWKDLDWNLLRIAKFYSSGMNMGMVIDRYFWDMFFKCGYEFCKTDDYNWDWTIQHLNQRCFSTPLEVVKPDAPRVWHIGDCGTHTKLKHKCSSASRQLETLEKLKNLVKKNTTTLFPGQFRTVSQLLQRLPRTPDPFGGWGDPRDHKLCIAILKDFE